MNAVTLYEQDRNLRFSELHEVHRNYIVTSLKDSPERAHILKTDPKVSDLENYLSIHYVDKNRDLSAVAPIGPKDYFYLFNQKDLQPLLDALQKGDFELAEALTPSKYRLCGYTELKETTRMEDYGSGGWAANFEITDVPAGIYPIFASKFNYHERNQHYTNEVHYTSVFQWYYGTCVASSSPYFKDPEPNSVFKSPYTFLLASEILRGKGNAHLIYPFQAFSSLHTDDDGKPYTTYCISDTTVPYVSEKNPIFLRGRCIPPEQPKKSLSEQLRNAEDVRRRQAENGSVSDRSFDQPSVQR